MSEMLAGLRKLKWNILISSLLYIVVGVFLVVRPAATLDIICYLVGGVVILTGVLQILRYLVRQPGDFFPFLSLVFGAVCTAVGVFLLLNSALVISVLPVLFGIFVLCDSIAHIQDAFELRRAGWQGWSRYLIMGAVSVVLGLLLILNPFGSMELLVRVIGIVLCVEGVMNIAGTLTAGHYLRALAAAVPEGTVSMVVKPTEIIEATAVEVDEDPQ